MNEEEEYCGEKFTKCSLHTRKAGCIIVAIYWMAYALSIPYARTRVFWREKEIRHVIDGSRSLLEWRKQIDDMQ